MNSSTFSAPACRHCRYYLPEGRRGGYCQQLNVAVQSGWKACSLAIPPFAPAWENLEQIMRWQERALAVQEVVVATCPPLHHEEPAAPEASSVSTPSPAVGIRALWSC
ncbi:hypothetical protein J5X98_07785 [Leptothermofonsia sichuanensis E412]|uniref:hypothetical protein n=1 Tax=Leptothermofonsia sichuanensis TaxID=2917832 RepID=UPI001CA66561|nr:hypothetical protein [Leptothermofonsia sichuanensis]QZZ22278.1 hypothetical protein J5X98_07785 [Leptothermofonsia sichuanensis E412]